MPPQVRCVILLLAIDIPDRYLNTLPAKIPRNKPKEIALRLQTHMIRVLIVDDHTIVRRGIKALLAEMDNIQVVGEADNGLEAISLSKELEPDVILLDLLMPVMDGIETTRQIIARQPHMRVLGMTSFIYHEKIIPAIRAGAIGTVMLESAPSELIQSIYKVHRGEQAFHLGIAS
jgi:DNA-binding NarL/FixJ family response regulator